MPRTGATATRCMGVHKGRKQQRTVLVKVSSVAKNNQKRQTTAGTEGIVQVICRSPSSTATTQPPLQPVVTFPSLAGCPQVPPRINTLQNNVIQFHSLGKRPFRHCMKRTGISSIFMSILT